MKTTAKVFIAAFAVMILATGRLTATADPGGVTLTVDSRCNIYGAGHAVPPDPSGRGAGVLPVSIPIAWKQGLTYWFSATGIVSANSDGDPGHGPDGGDYFPPTCINPYGGLGGIKSDNTMFLVGVFLDDTEPQDPAPPTLNFGSIDNTACNTPYGEQEVEDMTSFTQLTPQLRQVFFIGDGMTGTGTGILQRLVVPAGATRLFLGFADGFIGDPGGFEDNAGSVIVTIHTLGDIFVSDATANVIYRFSADGTGSTFATGLNQPYGLAFDSAGNLYEADYGSSTIYKFAPDGTRTPFNTTSVSNPIGLAFDSAGNLFEGDHGTGYINKFTPDGTGSAFATGLTSVQGLAFDSTGNLWAANGASNDVFGKIFEYAPDGTVISFITDHNYAIGLAFDSADNLFVTENDTGRIIENDPNNVFASGISGPGGLAFDSGGYLFVPAVYSGTIYKFAPDGASTSFASGLVNPTFLAIQPPATPTPTPGGCDTGAIQNGGFETGSFTPAWIVDDSTNAPLVTGANPHTGTYSGLVGNDSGPEPWGDSSFHQQFTVAAGGETLTFWHWDYTTDNITHDWQDAYIADSSGNILQTIFHQCENTQTWVNTAVDMTPYAGQTVWIKFLVHQDGDGDDTGMYVDDVMLSVSCPSPTPTPTATATATPTATATFTPIPTATATATAMFTPTPTATATFTPTPTPTATATSTPTPTATPTVTPTPTSTPCTSPAAPSAQAATNVTFSSFTAHWSSISGAIDYRLDVSTTNSFTTYVPGYQNLSVGNVTSFAVTGFSANTTYYYRVRASNGCATSRNSNIKNVQTLPCAPNAPNAKNATNVTFSSFTAHWSSVTGATDYRLDVSTTNTFTTYVPGYQNLSVGNVTSYSVTGLNANTTYYYRIRGYNGCATSPNSNVKGVKTTRR